MSRNGGLTTSEQIRGADAAINELQSELVEATQRARKLTAEADGRAFTVRPHPGRWSAAECLAHLTLTTENFLPVLQEALGRSPKSDGRRPKMGIVPSLFRWLLEPPVRSRFRTSAPFVPRAVRPKIEAFAAFAGSQGTLLDLLESARGLDLSAVKLRSPFDRRIRYNIYAAFRILVAHERRHLWQGEQALADVLQHRAALGA